MKTLRIPLFRLLFLLAGVFFFVPGPIRVQAADWNVAVIDKLLAGVAPGQKTVQVGDMEILVTNLRAWRNEMAGTVESFATYDVATPLWTGGNVYYAFSNNVSAAKQKAFLDAAGEWAMFANLHFIPRTAQANYVTVYEDPALSGGQSAVGMIGGQQFLRIGQTSWNRPTLCHELGHMLGLVHEHQRSDRDTYVTVLTSNLVPGTEGNFTKFTSSRNVGPYDFYSVMHYGTNTFSLNYATLNTLLPQPAYSQFLPIMGSRFDPVLSPLDRAGMVTNYGVGPALSSIVTNTLDSGPGSLRAALYYAFDHPGTTITFNIPTTDPGFSNGVFNILPTDALPSLVNATTLDGATQPTNSNPNGPEIFLNGVLGGPLSVYPDGLRFRGSNCTARGFVIGSFPSDGVWFDGPTTTGNTLAGCYIGLAPTGNAALTNRLCPVRISGGANGNIIGGINAADRNILSGSAYQGMAIRDAGTRNNFIQGNYIGLNAAGTVALPNTWAGIQIYGGASSNTIGGTVAGARNVISGNAHQGVALVDMGTTGNVVIGNYIGLNATGTAAIFNGWAGVDLFDGASLNRVGGFTAAERNVISGNGGQGIAASGAGTTGNVVVGNYIGLNPAGSAALPNGGTGVEVFNSASGTQIGSTISGAGNVISGNTFHGIALSTAANNTVQGNLIGLDAGGGFAVPNAHVGVGIWNGSQSNIVGGATASARNVISGNLNQGVVIADAGTRGNVVAGNFIGVNAAGNSAIGNSWAGVNFFNGPDANLIGGVSPEAGNVISGNLTQGVLLQDSGTRNNSVLGNFIGLNAAGTGALANALTGLQIYNGPSANVIGGPGGGRNFISGNGNYGVTIDNGSSANLVQGNTIGLNISNAAAVPNGYSGVALYAGAVSNQIGGLGFGAANLISGNAYDGVTMYDAGTTNNSVRGNSIVSNAGAGIVLYSSANSSAFAPSLLSAILGTNTVVRGTLTSLASTTFQIDFYANPAPAAGAEGMTYLGAYPVTTGAGGSVTFTNALAALIPAGRAITASATDSAGNTSGFSTGVAVTTTSTPNDAIPDVWRAIMFGGPGTTTNSATCATCDPDGDGMNNRAEFLSGTNPTNAASVFKLTALNPLSSGSVALLQSVAGLSYRIESRDDLATSPWSLFADQLLGTGNPILITDTNAQTFSKRFYRAGVLW